MQYVTVVTVIVVRDVPLLCPVIAPCVLVST